MPPSRPESLDPPTAPSRTSARPTADRLHLTVWADPLVERLGHDPRSAYVEQFWLGILGPSTVWFLRHCVAAIEQSPGATDATLDLHETAAALGLGHKGGRNSPLRRSIVRACRFGAARVAGETELQVRRRIPPLNRAQIERLPTGLARLHGSFLDHDLHPGDPATQRGRARRLALGLVECGDGLGDAERQLARWRFHPSVAADAVRWAWDQHQEGAPPGPDVA